MFPAGKRLRCAIYTRKSSEEGLDQSFNSLDAQREACAAYIESQRHEGWRALEARYDDGGYSGGSMDRPALKALLAGLEAGEIDVVVVYKVDRLTRSLADFAKIVELFDRRQVSFVSVTQQFNTTTSMGRLTLNVLLSFAQFEREVTGERIRDKIAASKKKGMWMGGNVPLGYDLKDRKLLVNEREAKLVRRIFERYVALQCVRKLQTELAASGTRSKIRTSRAGRKSGGVPYSRGALYDILQNRLYLGEIAHKGAVHRGEHKAIVPRETWDAAQNLLRSNRLAMRDGLRANSPSLLAGLLFDAEGHRLTPLHSTKGAKRYRYYTSQGVIPQGSSGNRDRARIPAHDIEDLVLRRVRALLNSTRELLIATAHQNAPASAQQRIAQAGKRLGLEILACGTSENRAFLNRVVSRIVIRETCVEIAVRGISLVDALVQSKGDSDKPMGLGPAADSVRGQNQFVLQAPAQFKRVTGAVRLIVPPSKEVDDQRHAKEALVKAIARAHQWRDMLVSGEVESLDAIARATGLQQRYVSRVLRCAFLAPSIVAKALDGSLPDSVTLDRLFQGLPMDWRLQERTLANS